MCNKLLLILPLEKLLIISLNKIFNSIFFCLKIKQTVQMKLKQKKNIINLYDLKSVSNIVKQQQILF